MTKAFHVLTAAGFAATLMAAIVGCSQAPEPNTSDSQSDSQDATTEQAATEDGSAESAPRKNDFRVVDTLTLPAPAVDPMAMVFQLRQPVGEPIGSEQIRLNYPAPGKAVVTVVIRGLQDDSVNATRTRYEFQPAPSSTDTNRLWQITQVTQQNKCQPGRGPQDWSGELCN